MNRRGFLQAILAAGVAPAYIGSSILMPVKSIIAPTRGAILGGTALTYADWAKRLDNQKVGDIIAILTETNELLDQHLQPFPWPGRLGRWK